MFFSISSQPNKNFFNHYKFKNVTISYDNGWQLVNDQFLYKGYTDKLLDITEVCNSDINLPGNYCVLDFSSDIIKIKHSLHRSFPIFYNDQTITNLEMVGNLIGAANDCFITGDIFSVTVLAPNKTKFKFESLTEDQVITNIDNILSNKIEYFVANCNKKIKVFLSGGIDSMLVFSYIKKYTNNYELLDYEHFEFDDFICKNRIKIKRNFWGYDQIHHWKTNEILSSGAPGDEFMLRNPVMANLFLLHHGLDILDIIDKDSMHYDYFTSPKNIKKYKEVKSNKQLLQLLKNKNLLYNYFCELNLNDFQHWHLGNTLTFTPLRDIHIFHNILQLPLDSAIGQIKDSKISKKLIEKQDAELLNFLSLEKNKESLENLYSLYKSYNRSL